MSERPPTPEEQIRGLESVNVALRRRLKNARAVDRKRLRAEDDAKANAQLEEIRRRGIVL